MVRSWSARELVQEENLLQVSPTQKPMLDPRPKKTDLSENFGGRRKIGTERFGFLTFFGRDRLTASQQRTNKRNLAAAAETAINPTHTLHPTLPTLTTHTPPPPLPPLPLPLANLNLPSWSVTLTNYSDYKLRSLDDFVKDSSETKNQSQVTNIALMILFAVFFLSFYHLSSPLK